MGLKKDKKVGEQGEVDLPRDLRERVNKIKTHFTNSQKKTNKCFQ